MSQNSIQSNQLQKAEFKLAMWKNICWPHKVFEHVRVRSKHEQNYGLLKPTCILYAAVIVLFTYIIFLLLL